MCARPALASGLALPFPDDTFAIAVCNQVYQYVSDPPALLAEIRRVLAHGGICFFSARNLVGVLSRRNWPPLLDRLVHGRLSDRDGWRATAGTLHPYWEVRSWAARVFEVFDYTRLALTDPALARYFAPSAPAFARKMIAAVAMPVMPTQLWVLRK
jgi:SAM-dependent methyltransferase